VIELPEPTPVDTDSIEPLIDAIVARGYVVVREFIDAEVVASLRSRALELDAAGRFSAAAVGHRAGRVERVDVRGDRICWLDSTTTDRAEQALFAQLEAVRLAANRALQLGLFAFESHYAIYAPGRSYARHRDRFRDDDARVLSIVLYLNDRWRTHEGGALRLHLADGAWVDVTPQGGTLAAFLSDRFAHEVLPATRLRLSIAGWFRRRA